MKTINCAIGASLMLTVSSIMGIADDNDNASAVVSEKQAVVDKAPWGDFLTYYTGTTFGSKDGLAGVAVIKAGMEIHPPHIHSEEEYMMVLEGEGSWHLNGKDFEAKSGDMLYAKPWDIHGITNTGDKPLKFVVWKWNTKGKPAPQNHK